jgi:hypothetical protein
MLLTSDTPTPATPLARRDSVFALVLLMTLLLATSTFFAAFALGALLAGLLLSVVLHRWDNHPADGSPVGDRLTGINIAAIHIGGDTGGLIFVLGSIAILALGLPLLRWFLVASVAVACAMAVVRITQRTRA